MRRVHEPSDPRKPDEIAMQQPVAEAHARRRVRPPRRSPGIQCHTPGEHSRSENTAHEGHIGARQRIIKFLPWCDTILACSTVSSASLPTRRWTNPSRHLWESLGFTVVGRIPEAIDGKRR